jgi:hypothetical protein
VTCASKKGFSQGEAPGELSHRATSPAGRKFRFVGQERTLSSDRQIGRHSAPAVSSPRPSWACGLMTWRPLTPRMHLVLAAHIRSPGNWSSGLLHLVRLNRRRSLQSGLKGRHCHYGPRTGELSRFPFFEQRPGVRQMHIPRWLCIMHHRYRSCGVVATW